MKFLQLACRFVLFVLLAVMSKYVFAQEYIYVNVDNLILRDRPEKTYNVFAILHAPCRIKKEPYEEYKNNRIVTNKFYHVSISYNDEGRPHYLAGWVDKKYTVDDLQKVTVPGAKMNLDISESEVVLQPYIGDDKHNPNNNGNARNFQAPKYKGGEKQSPVFRKKYEKGPRGGCYYINARGKKVYVESRLCNGVK